MKPSPTVSQAFVAKDLTKEPPRSPRELFAGYVLAARMLDKCRATISGTAGEYHFNCRLDEMFLKFTKLAADEFQEFVAAGADDEAAAAWIQKHAKERDEEDIAEWNWKQRCRLVSELDPERQLFVQSYVEENVPADKRGRVVVFFDMFDAEEGRL